MPTIEEFITSELGKPNKTPKHLILEAYALGVAHGKGEDYVPVPEDDTNTEDVLETVDEDVSDGDEEEDVTDEDEDESN